MKKIIYLILIEFFFCTGCEHLTKDEKSMSELLVKLNISTDDEINKRQIIIIPLEGCGKCIKQSLNEITNDTNKIFILSCFSKKSAHMVVGDNVLMYPNVFVDERYFAVKSSLVTTKPIFYLFKGNKCIMKKKY